MAFPYFREKDRVLDIGPFKGGISLDAPMHEIRDSDSPDMLNMVFENVVAGVPIPEMGVIDMLAKDKDDWEHIEKEKTLFTNERFLPRIMVEAGIVKSVNEVRRNNPKLVRSLDEPEYLEIKWGKKRLFILAGEVEGNEREDK